MMDRGFTLIEVLVGMIILAIGLLGIAAMQTTSVKGNYASGNVTRATVLAKSQLEYLRSLPLGSADLSIGKHSATGPVPTPFSVQYVVRHEAPSWKVIEVTASWTDGGAHSVTLKTLRHQ